MVEPNRIRHIAICALDVDAVAAFYQQTFGLTFLSKTANGQAIYLTDGHINFAIIRADATRPEGMYHFGFEVPNVDRTATVAVEHGASGPHQQPLDGRYVEAYIKDPAGTRVDISEHGWALEPA